MTSQVKTVVEIKAAVVLDQLPSTDLVDKEPAYVNAMFDVCVLMNKGETSMSKLMRETTVADVKAEPKVDLVDAARQRSIDRNKSKI